jgi:Carboxypeptidase regulatory-like domain
LVLPMSSVADHFFSSMNDRGRRLARQRAVSVCLFVLMFCVHSHAQQSGVPQIAPLDGPAQDSPQTGSVSGVVIDASGAAVAAARVSLLPRDHESERTATSGARGEFTFAAVPAGSYRVRVDAPEFATFLSQEFVLAPQQVYVVPEISLAVAAIAADITVRPIELIAEEQIKAQEKQRLLGVFPNFYVSYIPDAAPLNSRQKFSLAVHSAFDWVSFAGITTVASLHHATKVHAGYGRGKSGYAKRWAAFAADDVSDELLSHYVFPSLLHQDPRYFHKGTGTKKSRLYHALSSAVVARSDSGKLMPNYAYLLGDLSSAALSNTYYPRRDRNGTWFLINAALGVAGRAGLAVVEEFFGKHITTNVPPSHAHLPSGHQGTPPRAAAPHR